MFSVLKDKDNVITRVQQLIFDIIEIFFCYLLPAKDVSTEEWMGEAGFTKWYLYDIGSDNIIDDPAEILEHIRCDINTQKKHTIQPASLKEIRQKMDKHIKNTYLKSVQAPIGVKALLKTWMELS